MNSPFKFLDSYAANDREAFFGRDAEVAALYEMVTQNRLILVYGQSGTGKTSLIQCGLASRFDATDWLPVSIRRKDDLPKSLEQHLLKTANCEKNTSLPDALDEIYCTNLRPVYLIFDQLEELFIYGDEDEEARFVAAIRTILDASVPCRLLFVIREDYLIYLYNFERVIANLFDRRLRVEPMNTTKVKAVLKGSFQKFNIAVESPEEVSFEKIIGQVSAGRGVQLPFLQVYLDLFYREIFSQTYPGRAVGPNEEWPELMFSQKEIDDFGTIEQALDTFLREQKQGIQKEMTARFPQTGDDSVARILDAFVSEEGTKRSVGFEWQGDGLQMEARWAALFQPLGPAELGHACRQLETARLLRLSDGRMELAHDALAALIDRQRSTQQRRRQETQARLLFNFKDFKITGEFLSQKQLNTLEEDWPFLEKQLDAPVLDFVKQSFVQAKNIEKAELEAERKKARQARRVALANVLLLAAALIAAGFYYQTMQAKQHAASLLVKMQLTNALKWKSDGNYAEAIRMFEMAQPLLVDLPAEDQTKWREETKNWPAVQVFIAVGDSLKRLSDLRAALEKYEAALALSPDKHIEALIGQTETEATNLFETSCMKGYALLSGGEWKKALEQFEQAKKLRPENQAVTDAIEKCRVRLR